MSFYIMSIFKFFTSFVEVQSSECYLSLSVSESSLLINVTPYCETVTLRSGSDIHRRVFKKKSG